MDSLKEIFAKIELHNTLRTVTDKGLEKVAATAVGATLVDLGTIFALLIVLIIIDIFSRCVAEASRFFRTAYDQKIVEKRGSLLTYIKYLNLAHKWRYIDSFALRDGFWSKVISYFLIILTGFIGDQILRLSHIPPFCSIIFCGVLTCTEILSICENLNTAGVGLAGEIRDLVKKRKEGIK